MDMQNSLTLEQQFKLQLLHDQVKRLTREEAQNYLLEVLRQGMVKDNLVKRMFKEAS